MRARAGFTFVPLLEAQTGTVADMLAASLGARESAGESSLDGAVALLQAQPRLVLVDNAEHVLKESRSSSEAIAKANGTTVLVTNRHRLGASGEAIGAPQPEYLAATVETVARYVLLDGDAAQAARLIRAAQSTASASGC